MMGNAADLRLGAARVDLGSVVLPVFDGSRLRLTFGGGEELIAVAVVSSFGQVEVRAHATPRQNSSDDTGPWRPMLGDLVQGLRERGLQLAFEDGPWGRELTATGDGQFRRIMGREGDRWILVGVATGPAAQAAQLTDFARDVLAATQTCRGAQPHPARASLPLQIVDAAQLGEWERVDVTPQSPPAGVAAPASGPQDPAAFLPRFPDPDVPGAQGSAMQQLRSFRA